jgi:ABC-type transport system substrate-binding protein
MRELISAISFAFLFIVSGLEPAQADRTLRVVAHSDLKILDPIWTPAYITRNHGYMIYDTLFAVDAEGQIKPLEKYDETSDKLVYTFTLRDGLLWHDGQPVTADDCVASIKRWAAKDAAGQMLMRFVGRHAIDGLADACGQAREEGSTECWRLARFPNGECHHGHFRSDTCAMAQFRLRQSITRLAL